MRPQPVFAMTDVEASSRWYQRRLACRSGYGAADLLGRNLRGPIDPSGSAPYGGDPTVSGAQLGHNERQRLATSRSDTEKVQCLVEQNAVR